MAFPIKFVGVLRALEDILHLKLAGNSEITFYLHILLGTLIAFGKRLAVLAVWRALIAIAIVVKEAFCTVDSGFALSIGQSEPDYTVLTLFVVHAGDALIRTEGRLVVG